MNEYKVIKDIPENDDFDGAKADEILLCVRDGRNDIALVNSEYAVVCYTDDNRCREYCVRL